MSDITWRLVTVNTAPERAKRLIGRVADELKDRYTIVHVANADCKRGSSFHAAKNVWEADVELLAIEQVEPLVKEHKPNLLVSPVHIQEDLAEEGLCEG